MSRTRGHALRGEGAPYMVSEEGDPLRVGMSYTSVSGRGRAWCQCGALSPVFDSAHQRKKWHRAHKGQGLPA